MTWRRRASPAMTIPRELSSLAFDHTNSEFEHPSHTAPEACVFWRWKAGQHVADRKRAGAADYFDEIEQNFFRHQKLRHEIIHFMFEQRIDRRSIQHHPQTHLRF